VAHPRSAWPAGVGGASLNREIMSICAPKAVR
jgi:hypothetical protein